MAETTEKVTDKLIQDWKRKYGKVWLVEFEEGTVKGYFRKPDRKVLSYVMSLHQQPFKMMEQLVNNCWLGGDNVILTDESYLMGAGQQLQELVKIKEAELKEV